MALPHLPPTGMNKSTVIPPDAPRPGPADAGTINHWEIFDREAEDVLGTVSGHIL